MILYCTYKLINSTLYWLLFTSINSRNWWWYYYYLKVYKYNPFLVFLPFIWLSCSPLLLFYFLQYGTKGRRAFSMIILRAQFFWLIRVHLFTMCFPVEFQCFFDKLANLGVNKIALKYSEVKQGIVFTTFRPRLILRLFGGVNGKYFVQTPSCLWGQLISFKIQVCQRFVFPQQSKQWRRRRFRRYIVAEIKTVHALVQNHFF